jgi:8-oxo-dGTP pyrophosphatase MutT (NUDIX family)
MSDRIKIQVERKVLNQGTRTLKLDEQGRMQLQFPDGTCVKGTPQELFGRSRDLVVVSDSAVDAMLQDAIEKEILEETGL